ncbi:putative L-type lectin-domain containing receptor kinase S.5 [Acorus gramineus]|uniref:non-specific serine/threonine protein kinase n=1 Tax=Acorus gramineus TaxID=55184 RepID=A0AAV9BDD5_ACOGR|nr:putative L-type lectin-domain containing receptor kinase S.5 [Acorus gramineus]
MVHSLSSYDVLLILTFLGLLTEITTLQFSYPTFKSNNSVDFNYAAGSNLDGGTLQVKPDATTFNITNRSGRVTYKETFSLWKKKGSIVASFNTTFILNIYPFTRPGDEGLAFILANDRALPDSSNGMWLGIVNQFENGTSVAPIVAVEFDTRKSFPDDLDDNDLELTLADSARGPHKFKCKDLKFATSNFSLKNKLGQGGFGAVYKGYLKQIDREVAIKRVSKEARQGEQEFIAEVKTIGRLSHRNLVRLIGWCFDKMELLLVYEFFPKGSLDKLIFILSWERRLNIIHGVASALEYIHEGCNDKVLHRDVKASNVMLENEYNAKLGDFGMARVIRHGQRASVETDMYSFEVFIMELVCTRRPMRCDEYESLVGWVWGMYGSGRVLDAVDVRLVGEGVNEERVERVLLLGLICCHPKPKERPSMRIALRVLVREAPARSADGEASFRVAGGIPSCWGLHGLLGGSLKPWGTTISK